MPSVAPPRPACRLNDNRPSDDKLWWRNRGLHAVGHMTRAFKGFAGHGMVGVAGMVWWGPQAWHDGGRSYKDSTVCKRVADMAQVCGEQCV